MKTSMRKPDTERRPLAGRSAKAGQSAAAFQLADNRSSTLAQMKLMESIQAKEALQLQPEEDEELLQG